jgi:hypothetical protein
MGRNQVREQPRPKKVHKIPSQPTIEHNGMHPSAQAAHEGEKERIIILDSLAKKKVHETPSEWKKPSMVLCACHPSYSRKLKIRRW